MFQIAVGRYTLRFSSDSFPSIQRDPARSADLVDEHDLSSSDGSPCCIEVAEGNGWPFLVVAQRYESSGGFTPGVALVAETARLFVGAGTRLLAYDLEKRERVWEDVTQLGFWSWARHDDVIVMSAELELAAWDLHARKLWTRFVEPPWSYEVLDGLIHLDVMGEKTILDLRSGDPASTSAVPAARASEPRFVNVDVELFGTFDHALLSKALGGAVDVLHEGQPAPSVPSLTFELHTANPVFPDAVFQLIALVRGLPDDARAEWNRATHRVFDIGIERSAHAGPTPWTLSAEMMDALAAIGAEATLTFYGADAGAA